MRTLICFSVTEDDAARLAAGGPRRDIPMLARKLDATVLYRKGRARRGSRWLNRLAGPHIGDAWRTAGAARGHDTVFADGEHVGLPLVFLLVARGNRRTRPVVLGHLIDRRWKRALLWAGSRLNHDGTLIVHSQAQLEAARPVLGRTWNARLIPYQVDTGFWSSSRCPENRRPLVVSVGSEHRDYETLARAAEGLDVDVRIAAGSHWARERATATTQPANVEFIERTLSFSELRDLYASADIVVVPLHPVTNQSGVTTILEAMSMARPVVVSATPGQNELVTGPLVRGGCLDEAGSAGRGPHAFGYAPDEAATGWYVAPHDAGGLRAAIQRLAAQPGTRAQLGEAARRSAERNFTVEQFAERFAEVITAAGAER